MPFRLDDQTAGRLASGQVRPDDAPPGYVEVARLLDAAASPPAAAERGSGAEAATVAAMQAAIFGRLVPAGTQKGTTTMRSKLLSLKTAGTATAALLLAGGTAAAATGSLLPGSAQPTSAHVLSSTSTSSTTSTTTTSPRVTNDSQANTDTTDTGNGPSPNADFGLCNAESHNGGDPGKSDVFPSPAVCANVTHPGATSTNSGTEDSGTSGTSDDAHEPPESTSTDTEDQNEAPDTTTSEPPETETSAPTGTTSGDSSDGGASGSTSHD